MKIQCDRCKKIYDEEEDTVIRFNVLMRGYPSEYHICPECRELLKKFIENEEQKSKNRKSTSRLPD